MLNFRRKKSQIPPSGCIPSPEDRRDILLSAIRPLVIRYPRDCPAPFDLAVLNQGSNPYCVGYACAALKQYLEMKEGNSVIFDGEWIYKKCKEIDGLPNMPGTFLRTGLKVLQKYGAKPLNGTEEEAGKYKIGTYVRVDDYTFEGLKKATFIGGCLLTGFYGSNEGWQTAYIRSPKEGEKVWGHATIKKAYLENYGKGQNSWGGGWGDRGDFYISPNYLPFEAWIVMDLPTYQEGWVASEFLRSLTFQEGAKVKPTTGLRLRESPGLNGRILTTLAPSQILEIVKIGEKIDNWNWVKIRIIEEK